MTVKHGYTVAVREKRRTVPFRYIGRDLKLHDTTHCCAKLSREDAMEAKQRLLDGAKKEGREIQCRVVRILA